MTRRRSVVVLGYRTAPALERVAVGLTASFAVTILASRSINYAREQHRVAPRLRSFGRVLAQVPASNSVRVHHFLPGVAIGFAAGGIGLLFRAGKLEQWLSLPFGAGLALTTDELRVMVGRNNPYWGGEHFALAQSAVAAMVALGIGADFVRRGRAAEAALDRPAERDIQLPARDTRNLDKQAAKERDQEQEAREIRGSAGRSSK